jgi:hypothetical protein
VSEVDGFNEGIVRSNEDWTLHCGVVVAFSTAMRAGVTHGTERDEVQLGIFARMAAKFQMVDFQV